MKNRHNKNINAIQILIFVGGAIILLVGALAILGLPLSFTFMTGHIMVYPIYSMNAYIGFSGLISGIVILLSAFFMGSRARNEIQYWSALVLVFAVISLTGGGGLLIGFLLTFTGGILGITYKPVTDSGATIVPRQNVNKAHIAVSHSQTKIIAGLKDEERNLYEITKEAGGAIFQANLVEKSGFSKVKVSRILDRLEGRNLIERRRRGMTNMVVIKNGSNDIR